MGWTKDTSHPEENRNRIPWRLFIKLETLNDILANSRESPKDSSSAITNEASMAVAEMIQSSETKWLLESGCNAMILPETQLV